MPIWIEYTKRTVLVFMGSVVAAVGLQFFLLPNHMIDGGVTGLAIMAAKISGLSLGVFLLLLNIPFVMLGYKKFGKEFALFSVLGIGALASLTLLRVALFFLVCFFLTAIVVGLGYVFHAPGINPVK